MRIQALQRGGRYAGQGLLCLERSGGADDAVACFDGLGTPVPKCLKQDTTTPFFVLTSLPLEVNGKYYKMNLKYLISCQHKHCV